MVAFNVGFLMVVFLMLVFYSAWFFVFGLLFCCMFFDSKTRLTCKSNFFQLIFWLWLDIAVKGMDILVKGIISINGVNQ